MFVGIIRRRVIGGLSETPGLGAREGVACHLLSFGEPGTHRERGGARTGKLSVSLSAGPGLPDRPSRPDAGDKLQPGRASDLWWKEWKGAVCGQWCVSARARVLEPRLTITR